MAAVAIDALESGVHQPLTKAGQLQLLNQHLRLPVDLKTLESPSCPFAAYFFQYEDQCIQLSINTIGRLKHRHIAYALDLLLAEDRATCVQRLEAEARSIWKDSFRDARAFAEEWLAFTARALLLMSISEWNEYERFQDYTRRFFDQGKKCQERVKLPRTFHLRSLERVCGTSIRWTSILSEHLELENDDHRIAIFHQVFMLTHLVAAKVFDEQILEDTESSLALLLPRQANADFKWFERRQRRFHLDPKSFPDRGLQTSKRHIGSLGCWCERISILKETYDEHEPEGFFQNLRDTRKPARVWAFWAAVLIFFFGLIQSMLSAIQVYKAYHPS